MDRPLSNVVNWGLRFGCWCKGLELVLIRTVEAEEGGPMKKHRELRLLIALVLVLGCKERSSAQRADESPHSEPRSKPEDGYQGVAWGSPESVAIERGLHCTDSAGSDRLCTGKGRLGRVDVTENFTFSKAGLRSVLLEARPEEFVALKDLFNQKYGGSHVVERVLLGQGHSWLEWSTETTNISLENVGPEAVASFVSKAALVRDREVKP